MSASLRPVSGSAGEILALLREWDAARSAEPLVIATSGSTGEPKRVVLSREALRASASATHQRLDGPGQWVLNLPATYVAGLQVLYRSVLAGTEPLVFEGSWRQTLARTAGPTYVSLVPTQLVRLLRAPDLAAEVDALGRCAAVLIGGGPLDPRVREEAERRGLRIVQTYGMSETCGGCVYDGLPLAGVEVHIDDGAVLLRGPMLFDGYEGDAERTRAVLREGWFHTFDLGHWEDQRLRIDGRADDVVISGGVKVPAAAVVAGLERQPEVAAACVVGVPDDEWGERVVAVLVPRAEPTRSLDPDPSLPRAWWPKDLVWVPSLPLLPNGKPDRLRARELATAELTRG
ncbi:MAG TPA: AMP-binding protein [Marmoricola sp.]